MNSLRQASRKPFWRRLLARWGIAHALFSALSAGPNLARAGDEVEIEAQVSVRETYRQAYAAIDRSDWPEARRLLAQVWEKIQTHDVAAAIGQVEYRLKHYSEAVRYLEYAVEHLPPQVSTATFEHYQSALAEAKALVGQVKIVVNRPGVEIVVDGNAVGRSPLRKPTYVDPGSHSFAVRHDGRIAGEQRLTAAAGQTYTIKLIAPEPASGTSPAPTAPAAPQSPSATATPRAPVPASDGVRNVVIYAGIAATALSLGGHVFFRLKADAANDDAERLQRLIDQETEPSGCASSGSGPCRTLADKLDTRASASRASNVFLVVTGVLAAGTVATVLAWPKERRETASSLMLSASPTNGGAALTLGGGF